MTRKPQAPSYDRYRGKYARVVIDRRSIHLGKYDCEESHRKYRELIATWSAVSPSRSQGDESVSVAELLADYSNMPAAITVKNPKPLSAPAADDQTVRRVLRRPARRRFSPKKLKVVRQAFVEPGTLRGHVNDCVQRVVAIFRGAGAGTGPRIHRACPGSPSALAPWPHDSPRG